jgi:hypothetical protein
VRTGIAWGRRRGLAERAASQSPRCRPQMACQSQAGSGARWGPVLPSLAGINKRAAAWVAVDGKSVNLCQIQSYVMPLVA